MVFFSRVDEGGVKSTAKGKAVLVSVNYISDEPAFEFEGAAQRLSS